MKRLIAAAAQKTRLARLRSMEAPASVCPDLERVAAAEVAADVAGAPAYGVGLKLSAGTTVQAGGFEIGHRILPGGVTEQAASLQGTVRW